MEEVVGAQLVAGRECRVGVSSQKGSSYARTRAIKRKLT